MSLKFRLISSAITALFMAMCMSFIMASVNVGFVDIFFSAWLKGWGIGFCVTFPLSFFIPPLTNKFLKKIGIN